MNDKTDLPRAICRMYAAAGVALHEQASSPDALRSVIHSCMDVLPVDGAFVSLMNGTRLQETLFASDDVADQIDSVQFSLGEGPCFEAFATGSPVLAPDLSHTSAVAWPVFATAMDELPVGAIFAFPLQMGRICIGTIGLYCRRPRLFSENELAIALEVTDLVGVVLLGLQLAVGDSWRGVLAPGNAQLHQATGMLVARFGVSAEEALARLRGYAFAVGRPVYEVAHAVVTRALSPLDLD